MFIDKALLLNPRHSPSLHFVIGNHIDAEQYDLAESVIERALDINPNDPRRGLIEPPSRI